MRVIAGSLGGRKFNSPRTVRTHPMSDKVRGALFNTLGDIEGLSVLDAFAGSGALGFEALSRGAVSALLIENDRPAQKTIAANILELQLGGRARLVGANCSGWSDNNPDNRFDLVLADPPFNDLQLSLVHKLSRHVAAGGLLVVNWPGGQADAPPVDDMELLERKSYGDTRLFFYR